MPRRISEEFTIMVEGMEGAGNVPRNATGLANIIPRLDLDKQLRAAAAMAELALGSLKQLGPDELSLEFGIELGGTFGVPLVTHGTTTANFTVTLKWSGRR
jgi:hypothetical protein